jgi:hypothetical protein
MMLFEYHKELFHNQLPCQTERSRSACAECMFTSTALSLTTSGKLTNYLYDAIICITPNCSNCQSLYKLADNPARQLCSDPDSHH